MQKIPEVCQANERFTQSKESLKSLNPQAKLWVIVFQNMSVLLVFDYK